MFLLPQGEGAAPDSLPLRYLHIETTFKVVGIYETVKSLHIWLKQRTDLGLGGSLPNLCNRGIVSENKRIAMSCSLIFRFLYIVTKWS